LCLQSIHKLKGIADKVGLKDFAFNKSLYYAAYKKDTVFLKAEFNMRKAMGFPLTWLATEDLRKDFGIKAPSAILSDDGAYADAYLFTHALHQHGIHHGLRVFDRTYAKHILHHTHGVTLTTAENVTIRAKKVVYATGYEAVEMIGKKIVDLQSTYATISEHMPNAGVVVNQDVMIWNTAKPYLYLRKTTDGRVIVGGRDEPFVSAARRDKLIGHKSKLLARDFQRLFPGTAFNPEFSWTGTFGSTADGLPFIGKNRQYANGYFALGFGGNGITFSLIAAEITTDLLLGKDNDDARIFSFERRSKS
jgi:glycine/D-amino acid oxidase-like deaminating enzyme